MAEEPTLQVEGRAHGDYDQVLEVDAEEEEEEGEEEEVEGEEEETSELSDIDSTSASESESDDDGVHSMLATHHSPFNTPAGARLIGTEHRPDPRT